MMPTTRTTAAATARGRFAGAGANAAAATSSAGATASSSEYQVAASGSALVSAEIVISCAAPARISAPRIQAQLGGAGTAAWRATGAALVVGAVSAGVYSAVIGFSWRTRTGMSRRPAFPAHLVPTLDLPSTLAKGPK